MQRNAASFYANSGAPNSERYLADPWVDMGHVDARIAAKYGANAPAVTRALQQCERERHAERSSMVAKIPSGRDIFQRNLRTLAYIADGKLQPNPTAIKTLYADALADLETLYPPTKKYGEISPHEVWKHLLDTAKEGAEKAH